MTRDPRAPAGADPLDDAAIEQLVRDVAERWTMPPVRLDAPSWRDRVRSPGVRRLSWAGGWLGRVGQAATAAIALTVVGGLVAVMLTRPPDDPGTSPAPSDGSTPRSSEGAEASLLPKLLVEGDLPNPSELLVGTEAGDFALVNLATGTMGGPLTGTRYGSQVRVRADGWMVCLCLSESGIGASAMPSQAQVRLDRFDPSGTLVSSTPIETFNGEPDPRDVGVFLAERPPHVLTAMGFSAGGRYGFVGWSFRAHPAWRSGILVVDLQDGAIVSRLDLPDGSTGGEDTRRVVFAPRVVGSTSADGLLVARGWYEWSPPQSESPTFRFENEVYRVDFAGGQLSDAVSMPFAAADCGDAVLRGGALPDGGAWLACTSGGTAQTIVRRLDAAGSMLGDVRVSGGPGIEGDPTAVSPDGKTLFVWDPASATITKVDVASGDRKEGHGLTARLDTGPLAAFGQWLAPIAAAKSFLHGSIVLSPDGTRVYAIGIKAGVDERDLTGSAGVFAFDASSLESLGIWQPTADFVSLAVSADGRFVYAAGLPGVDLRGRLRRDQQASITVFDARDGSVRLIAGELGGSVITFGSSTLD